MQESNGRIEEIQEYKKITNFARSNVFYIFLLSGTYTDDATSSERVLVWVEERKKSHVRDLEILSMKI